MKRLIIFLLASLLQAIPISAQTRVAGKAEFDRTVYDFGDISLSDGAVNCTFNVTNIGKNNLTILNVVSSCGCTNVKWMKEDIAPGKKGYISATYKNNEGPVPFDKTLTVYLSDVKQPIILRLRGISHEKQLPLNELYTVKRGELSLKSEDIPRINLNQGQQKSGEIPVANTGSRPVKVEFVGVSDGLSLKLDINPIPAESTAKLSYTFTASRERWGLNHYYATPVVNGITCKNLHFMAATKEDFSSMSKEDKAAGANPKFGDSVFTFNPMKAGASVDVSFSVSNIGKSTLHIYKIDIDSDAIKMGGIPDITPGQNTVFKGTLDTSKLQKGEVRIMITLTTNSPLRPLVNLFVTGFIN